jgi:hypothetical protein
MSVLEQLAIVTRIRQEISNDKSITDEDLVQLVKNTNLMSLVLQILEAPSSPDMKYLKLEAGWILTNIAYGSEDVLSMLFTDQFIRVVNFILNEQPCDIQMVD